MMCANNRVHYGLLVCYLHITLHHYHHYVDISEGIELANTCQAYSVSSMCLSLGQYSQLSFLHYMGLCVSQLTHLSYDDCENTCT